MRCLWSLPLFLSFACYNPSFVSGQFACSQPGDLCPEGFSCQAGRCYESADLAMSGRGDGPGPADDLPRTVPYLRAVGGKIVDASGKEVRLTGVSWFGMDTASYVVNGLWQRPLGDILDSIKSLGYNTIRLPFVTSLMDPGSVPRQDDIDDVQNRDLKGLSPLAVLDRLVAAAEARKLKIILTRKDITPNQNAPLWYDPTYSQDRWINDWKALAMRYRDHGHTVIGFELAGQLHGTATWGDGKSTDFRLAAELAGNAILAQNPGALIIVPGIDQAAGTPYWWGGNLKAARANPVRLAVAERLVYATIDYPPSFGMTEPWFRDINNISSYWTDVWGYLVKENRSPVIVAEFGTANLTDPDRAWFGKLTPYLRDNHVSFMYFALNNNTETGLLAMDWKSVASERQAVHTALKPLLDPIIP